MTQEIVCILPQSPPRIVKSAPKFILDEDVDDAALFTLG